MRHPQSGDCVVYTRIPPYPRRPGHNVGDVVTGPGGRLVIAVMSFTGGRSMTGRGGWSRWGAAVGRTYPVPGTRRFPQVGKRGQEHFVGVFRGRGLEDFVLRVANDLA